MLVIVIIRTIIVTTSCITIKSVTVVLVIYYSYGDHARLAMGLGQLHEYALMLMLIMMLINIKLWHAIVFLRGSGFACEG